MVEIIVIISLSVVSVVFIALYVRERRRSKKDRALLTKWNVAFKERRWKEKMNRNKK